jgi:tetratricopeptide (TPR) repeat protein
VAALVGETFDRAVLAAALGWSDERVLSAIADAGHAAILVSDPTGLRRCRFTHALIGEILRSDLGPSRAPALHRRIGEALEAVYGADSVDHVSQLADHFFEGLAGGDAERAIDYAVRSARRAAEGFAWEEAIRQYERVLAVLQPSSAEDPRRMQILLELGDAHWRTGDAARGKDTCLRAVALARRSGAAVELARGALGFCGEFAPVMSYDDARACLLEEALAALGDAAPALRARVLARLSRELCFTADVARGLAHADEAVRVARGSGDRATLVTTLTEWHILATAAGHAAEDRRARADELVHLAQESGTLDLLAWARMRRISDGLERGEAADLAHEIHTYASLARQISHRDHIWFATVARAQVALLAGRFDDAERLMTEALNLGQHLPRLTAFGSYWLQLFMLRRAQGRLAELEPILALRPSSPLGSFLWPSTLALVLAELGREADARSEFDELAANGFLDVPRTSIWPIAIGNLAEVCAVVGDASRAALLYDLLLPHAGRTLARGTAWSGLYSTDHYLGLLAATMSKRAAAAGHFEAALAFDARMGARPLVARAQVDYAWMLRTGSVAERAKAKELLEGATASATGLGMQGLLARADALHRELSSTVPPPGDVGTSSFRREGDVWTVTHGGQTFAVKDRKGLHAIARLLREPGREFHCLDLVVRDAGSSTEELPGRRRLVDVQADLAEAERRNDVGWQTAAREEMERLRSTLTRAAGLGGDGGEVERAVQRARVNVSRTIKDAIAKIREYDPRLARHLANAIRTGVLCSYTPEPGTAARWTV